MSELAALAVGLAPLAALVAPVVWLARREPGGMSDGGREQQRVFLIATSGSRCP